MAKVAITEQYLSDIADAIREKTGDSEATYLPSEMAEAIADIEGGGITPSGTYSITSNGIYDIVSFASVDVNVSGGGGGDHDVEDSLVTKTIHGVYENSRVERIGRNAFAGAALLSGVSIPNATFMDIGAFQGCSKLSFAYMPLIRSIQQSAFLSCLSLTSFYAPHVSYIGASAFTNCSFLTSLYLLSTSIVSLANRSAFNGTPMSTSAYAHQWGSIYVPASLVDEYKSKANWSYYSSRITAYEE